MAMKNEKRKAGFTLTEMLIVIALIALVGTFVTSQIINRYNRAKIDATRIQVKQMGTVLQQFYLDCGFYPSTEQGLESLITKPPGRECKNYDPKGYIEGGKVPKDAWNNDFVYSSDANTYEIKSLGPSGREDATDTISSKDL
jgi:general secretion pathway protein G